jgi:hypothetical protein
MGNGAGNLSAEEQKAIQDATQLAGMYLRSSSHTLSKHPYLPIGKRPNEKQYFLVNHPQTKEDRLMVMALRSEESPLALHVEANKALFTGFLEGLKHPYVLPMLEVDYLSDRNMAVLFKPFSNKAGSLRDSIVKCKNPKDPFDQKYQKAGNQISIRLVCVCAFGCSRLTHRPTIADSAIRAADPRGSLFLAQKACSFPPFALWEYHS